MINFPIEIRGTVVRGAGRGTALGFPTANLDTRPPAAMPYGIYAGWVTHNSTNAKHPAAIYWGTRPTFGASEPVLEAYLLNESGDWYGHEVTMTLVAFVRDDIAFTTPAALAFQMKRDAQDVANKLGIER